MRETTIPVLVTPKEADGVVSVAEIGRYVGRVVALSSPGERCVARGIDERDMKKGGRMVRPPVVEEEST